MLPTSNIVCSYCARLADPAFPVSRYQSIDHCPSIETLLTSSKSCPLCHVLVGWISEEKLNTATIISEGGYKTRIFAYAVGGTETTEVFKTYCTFTIDSPILSSETPRFILGAIKRCAEKRAIWKSAPVSLSARTETFLRWVHDCENHHVACHDIEQSDEMPTRLIDVGCLSKSDKPRLVDVRKEGVDSSNKYLALSYCWGLAGVPIRTISENLALYMESLPQKDLPQTFQDAIEITRQMSIRYLWIDALCIVQDDPSDWEHEAAKMAAVFNNAYITISASSAADCEGGCETSLSTVEAHYFKLPDSPNKDASTHIFVQGDCSPEEPFMKTLMKFPTNSRGWILQELISSRRILHFTKTQCLWQCHSLLQSEDQLIHKTWAIKKSENDVITRRQVYIPTAPLVSLEDLRGGNHDGMTWWYWILDHATRKLTFPSDDLPPLAGIMSFYSRLTKDEPIVGLWKNKLQIQLAWIPKKPFSPSHRLVAQPTWSWTSIDRQIREKAISHSQLIRLYEFKDDVWKAPLGDIDIQWKGQSFTSPLLSATLTLGRVQWPQPSLSTILDRSISRQYKGSAYSHHSTTQVAFHDEENSEAEAEKSTFLLWVGGCLRSNTDPSIYTFRAFSLMIKAIDGFERQFQRVGVIMNEWDCLPEEAQAIKQQILSHLDVVDFVQLV